MSQYTDKANEFIQNVDALTQFVNGDVTSSVTLPNGQIVSSMRKLANDTVTYLNDPANHYTKAEIDNAVPDSYIRHKGYNTYNQIATAGAGLLLVSDCPIGSYEMMKLCIKGYMYRATKDANTVVTVYDYTADATAPQFAEPSTNNLGAYQFNVTVFEYNGFVSFYVSELVYYSNLTFNLYGVRGNIGTNYKEYNLTITETTTGVPTTATFVTPIPTNNVLNTVNDSGDITPTLLNGATLLTTDHLSYRKTPDGTVLIQGIIRTPPVTGTVVFTLPAGYRPDKDVFSPAMTDNFSARAYTSVGSSGNVIINYGSTTPNWFMINTKFKAVL